MGVATATLRCQWVSRDGSHNLLGDGKCSPAVTPSHSWCLARLNCSAEVALFLKNRVMIHHRKVLFPQVQFEEFVFELDSFLGAHSSNVNLPRLDGH